MFVVLEHFGVDEAADGAERHWDLLIELPDAEALPTWRLAENPAEQAGPIEARRIADHRKKYLDYEGPIGGGRGEVARVDRGGCDVLVWTEELVTMELAGERLRGLFVLYRVSDESMILERGT